jgi:hypothetical protein
MDFLSFTSLVWVYKWYAATEVVLQQRGMVKIVIGFSHCE